MNYMEQVARMLGVEIGEEFNIKGVDARYRFTAFGLQYYDDEVNEWDVSFIFIDLLAGKTEIIKKPWKPSVGERYFSANPFECESFVGQRKWKNRATDRMLYRLGNCYPTREAAEADSEKWERFYADDSRIEWEDGNG